ncbi:hypothetical protein [Blastococcus montanus]|uniref:hypothetical protein n=1 Tax=Blastococcus montanus TaxID=3144973 RepID=UPI00320B00FA
MRVRRLVSTALAAAGLSVAFAAPAQADHIVDIVDVVDGTCRLGGLASGVGVDVIGQVVQQKSRDGATTRYTCQFRGIPSYVSAEDSAYGEEFVMPRNGFTTTVICSAPAPGGGESYSEHGRLRVTPSGNATVQCSGFDSVL